MTPLDAVIERDVAPSTRTVDMKLEVVVPVAHVDRAKRFYGGLGWRIDSDFVVGDDFRVVQFTAPGSPCSIHFGTGVTSAVPDAARGFHLVVSDIQSACAGLIAHGVEVSAAFHRAGAGRPPAGGEPRHSSNTNCPVPVLRAEGPPRPDHGGPQAGSRNARTGCRASAATLMAWNGFGLRGGAR